MPQDPNLYGQRPAKKQRKEIPLSSSLAFTSQLTSLLAAPSSSASASTATASSGRARPSKNKDDIFSVKAKRKPGAPQAKADDGSRLFVRDVRGTDEDKKDFERAKRRMEEKARLYAAMKRGDYVPKDGEAGPLVDFDAKWAAAHPEADGGPGGDSSSGADNDSDDDDEGGNEIIEYKDEFGRTRRGTRADVARLHRRQQRRELGAEELDAMSARPRAPEKLIYGDAIQSHAFNPEDATWDKMQALAAKRDRSPTPPEATHYDGHHEIRTKGVGFYHFSRDHAERDAAMRGLEAERQNTEQVRRRREHDRDARRREIEDRRRAIAEKRSKRMADDFLEDLGLELAAGAAGGKPEEQAAKEAQDGDLAGEPKDQTTKAAQDEDRKTGSS
ncbi:uncharacterized protein JN550_006990 [Neoarthrinium moseri]|uniref:uncharacterized protein n=1 Tax=Neoarthrinium moseri TaxID=1658444 RepID=UPI001FDADFE7|nr:uncharacterized protein JN550_006990 [Neoarthrinium moseri]KAI1867259.1 hypothetical protein JN550_006990 [Neoarthrinium moseri]